jgi:hypothetical protein
VGSVSSDNENLHIPKTGYMSPLSVKIGPISWIPAGVSNKPPNGKIIQKGRHGIYTIYQDEEYSPVLRKGNLYYSSGDHACELDILLTKSPILFVLCSRVTGLYSKIVDFSKNRMYVGYNIFFKVDANKIYLLSDVGGSERNRNDSIEFPYPEFEILNLKDNTITKIVFPPPSEEYRDETTKCFTAHGIDVNRGLLPYHTTPSNLTVFIGKLGYSKTNEDMSLGCRLKFVFDTKNLKGRYFL